MKRRASRKSGLERQRRTRKQRGGAEGEPMVPLPVRRFPLLSGHPPTPRSELGGVSPVPVSTPSVPVADKNGQRRPLQRGVAGRHLNKVSYLSEASKAAANKVAANKAAANKAAANKIAANQAAAKKATRRAKLALEKTRVTFNEKVTASNKKTEGKLANNSKRFGDGKQQFSNLKRYEGAERIYGPLGSVHYTGQDNKPDYEIFDKGLWSTTDNKKAATAEMREEMRRGKMYVNLGNQTRSLTNYRPTGKNREEAARLNATRRSANVAKEAARLNATRRAANAAKDAPPINEDPS